MRVSMKWLRELVPVDLPAEELADRLDLTGTAVDAVETVGAALEGVVVGRIVTKERHPDAEKLWVTRVDVGAGEPVQIVCGAQNFEAGDKVPVATVGTTLPNGVTIKKAKLRGVESQGMNCSATELGVGGDASGLLILPEDAPVGASFAEYRGLADVVTLSVHNQGPPIPADQQAAIFEDGRQAGVPRTHDRRHQGLGLYIVDRIVAAHGGTVSVASSAADGTTFTVRLPRKG
jgi:tRNA-binding EMAP/Myf-like protein